MKKKHFLTLTCLLCVLACCIAANPGEAQGWALQVVEIQVDGKAVTVVKDVAVIAPGKDKAERRDLHKGSKFEQGAEIVVPPRTVLVLASENGNTVRLQPGAHFKVNVVGREGETYSLLAGQALFTVSKALNFFNVNYQSFVAIVRGTEFHMAVEPQKEIRFGLLAGRLVVQREVKVKILEGDKVAQLTASEVLKKGGKTQVSYRLGVEEYLREFKTYKDAEEYYRRQLQEDEKSGEYERIQQGLNDVGWILIAVGKYREASGYFERAMKAAREHHDNAWEAVLFNNQGLAYIALGEYLKANEYFEKALALNLNIYPDGVHPELAKSYWYLGSSNMTLGKYRKVIEYHEKALAIYLKLYPDGVYLEIADCYTDIGSAYVCLGRYQQAIEYYEKALALNLKLYPDGVHWRIAQSYLGLGTAYFMKSYTGFGEYQGYRMAIENYEKALAIDLKLYPDEVHPIIAGIYMSLGSTYVGLREFRTAIAFCEKALALQLKLYPDGLHPDIASSYQTLGAAYLNLSDYRQAIGYYDKTLSLTIKFYPEVHPEIAAAYRNLSLAWQKVGDTARAEEYAKKAEEIEARLRGR